MIRSLFVSMQELNKLARRPAAEPAVAIRKVGIVGAGFMGAGIAHVSARAGIEVVLIDRDMESAEKGKASVEANLARAVSRGRASEADKESTLSRIHPGADFAVLADVDLVIEAVFEDRAVKEDMIARIEAVIGPDTIFGSNTSTLPITSLAAASERPKNFIGIHFFSPVDRMMLVEVIMGKKTGDAALARALDFVRQIRKTPIVVNDSRCFYTSRVVTTFIGEGQRMLTEGVPAAMVENAARMAGMPVGPLSLNDETAVDLSLKIMNATIKDLGAEAVAPEQYRLVREMVEERGRLGRKNRKGFYDYPENPRREEDAVAGARRDVPAGRRSRHDRCRGAEAALPRHPGAGDGALLRRRRADRRARGRCRLDPRLRFRALYRRHALLYRLHGRSLTSSPCATGWRASTVPASSRIGCCATWRRRARPSMAAFRRKAKSALPERPRGTKPVERSRAASGQAPSSRLSGKGLNSCRP